MDESQKETLFRNIFDQHYEKVFRICKGFFLQEETKAEDLTQEIFVRVWNGLDAFRKESDLFTWIYRIAVNSCLLSLRKSKREQERMKLFRQQEQWSHPYPSATDGFIASENDPSHPENKIQLLYGCIDQLNYDDRMVILLVLENIDYPVIADTVGISQENLRVRIHRIKKKISKCVQS